MNDYLGLRDDTLLKLRRLVGKEPEFDLLALLSTIAEFARYDALGTEKAAQVAVQQWRRYRADMPNAARIRAKYPGVCAACRGAIRTGDEMLYDAGVTLHTTHTYCAHVAKTSEAWALVRANCRAGAWHREQAEKLAEEDSK